MWMHNFRHHQRAQLSTAYKPKQRGFALDILKLHKIKLDGGCYLLWPELNVCFQGNLLVTDLPPHLPTSSLILLFQSQLK